MSYSSLKSSLDSALEALGYKQNKLNLSLNESFEPHKYTVETTITTEDLTNSTLITTYNLILNVGYICNSNDALDSAIDSFVSVMTAVKNLSEFVGFTQDASYERLENDNKKFIFTIAFNYGIRSC